MANSENFEKKCSECKGKISNPNPSMAYCTTCMDTIINNEESNEESKPSLANTTDVTADEDVADDFEIVDKVDVRTTPWLQTPTVHFKKCSTCHQDFAAIDDGETICPRCMDHAAHHAAHRSAHRPAHRSAHHPALRDDDQHRSARAKTTQEQNKV